MKNFSLYRDSFPLPSKPSKYSLLISLIFVITYLLVTLFLIKALSLLSYFRDIETTSILLDNKPSFLLHPALAKVPPGFEDEFMNFRYWLDMAKPIGLLAGFVLSLIICIRKKIHWMNSLLVLIIGAVFLRYRLNAITGYVSIFPLLHMGWKAVFITDACISLLLCVVISRLGNKYILKIKTLSTPTKIDSIKPNN